MQRALWKCCRGSRGNQRVGCNFWNVYESRHGMNRDVLRPYSGVKHNSKTSPYSRACKGSGFGMYRPRTVDTRCRHCNARVRFQLSQTRGDGRGRPRRVIVSLDGSKEPFSTKGPRIPFSDWPLLELIDRCNLLNRGVMDERNLMGFIRAKDYQRD